MCHISPRKISFTDWLPAVCLLLLLCLPFAVQAQQTMQLDFAVLLVDDKQQALPHWQAVIGRINASLPDVELNLHLLNFEQMRAAVEQQQVDFVLLNSAMYIELERLQGLSVPLASMVGYHHGQALRGFGGVILVRDEAGGITRLEQLRGSTIATPGISSLGGYMTQAYELQQHGIEPHSYSIIQTDMPHSNAIDLLRSGQADAAFIRTGILEEQPSTQGLRVLNPQRQHAFPQALSTSLYPEWPIGALAHVRSEVMAQVAGAFLMLQPHEPALLQAGIYGFSVPQDYQSVHDIMRSLRVKPYDNLPLVTWSQVWQQYHYFIVALALLGSVVIILSAGLLFSNRRLARMLLIVRKNEESQRLSAVALETQQAIVITDAQEKILRVNQAFTLLTGYQPEQVLGQTPRFFKSGHHDAAFYAQMWHDIASKGSWHGEFWNKKADGTIYPIEQMITAVKNPQGQITHYLAAFSDLTTFKQSEERIHQLAYYDPLTGLANRRMLDEQLAATMRDSGKSNSYCALMFIDLDHFKRLNDTLGFAMGDELLRQVARRISKHVRASDTVVRQAGDDFVVLMRGLGSKQDAAITQAQHMAENILQAIGNPFQLFEHKYMITASIGISLFRGQAAPVEELLKRSDIAVYQAKAEGRHSIRFFEPQMQETASKRGKLELELRRAVLEQHFVLHYQIKVNYQGQLHGYEALLRWQHPEWGMVPPMEFIALAEDSGLIIPIGNWVLREACRTITRWQQDEGKRNLVLAINISARQFASHDFVNEVRSILAEFRIPPGTLEMELTESLLLESIDDAINIMTELKSLGIRLALDDFGTGYSSLNYLKDLPLDCLKIDQSFVRDMLNNADDAAIVETVITLAKSLRLSVIAEGVEQPEQAEFLYRLGCDLLQGYFYGRPGLLEFNDQSNGQSPPAS